MHTATAIETRPLGQMKSFTNDLKEFPRMKKKLTARYFLNFILKVIREMRYSYL